eukprot:gnl/TRDRNA2_/TRDRNA2_188162_c0_seq1.p1 gnl/TRDRNA2_/TRDRNA2_188162_c0~~gnl/TRDRNA2_/TRDRNA2_188162_c0_seq1.p1  ORF type:complete len:929 (+),score=138.21 gnl/TRDRNA2_/TRDRNA2_188162_c0_seq1:78-2864(+)
MVLRGVWGASLAVVLCDVRRGGADAEKKHGLVDVSNEVCWVGDFTKDHCCQGDETTRPDCWDDMYSFGECCPNADCWDGDKFTYQLCCDTTTYGSEGNPACWSGVYNYAHCCLANASAQSWVDVFVGGIDTDQFYGMDEFYTDAQYGDDFGYYSTGRVLRAGKVGKETEEGELEGERPGKDTQQFAHYTTYPMALSPHFGRIVCRLLFLKWIHLGERTPFRVVEMGAGSGQLAVDTQKCVRNNELGIAPSVWRRWAAAFEYLILERSPALRARQQSRGLRSVRGDAQTVESCPTALATLAASTACSGNSAKEAPECASGRRATAESGASVVISNELLDAFAPVKLRLSLFEEPNPTDCKAWQEIRMVHTIHEAELRRISEGPLQHTTERTEALVADLKFFTTEMFCHVANSTVGRAARESVPEASCLALVLGLSELLTHADLQLPKAAHNMRLRLRKDRELVERLRISVRGLDGALGDAVVLPRQVYRLLRHQLRTDPLTEVSFLSAVQTRRVPAPLTEERCGELQWWFEAHKQRVLRLAHLYRSLGYPAISLLVRPGERNFVELVDCLLGPSGGYVLSVDYGASFEALGHSLSVDPSDDGIFIPPVPHELMEDLPDCYAWWPTCAGRVDWTTFVDFTNLAMAGEQYGWQTLFYGPQSLLEHISRRNVTFGGKDYIVPGYAVLSQIWASRHVQNWYGREELASKAASDSWQQRWTSFKCLLLFKPPASGQGVRAPIASSTTSATLVKRRNGVIVFPSWHLDQEEVDSCWNLDPSALPLADWVRRHNWNDPRKAIGMITEEINKDLGRDYAITYEEAQLAVRMVDWLVAAEGCENFRPAKASSLLGSEGLWKKLLKRLLRVWEHVWGAEAVERVALGILRRLAAGPDEVHDAGPPSECIGQQTYERLCSDPEHGIAYRGGSSVPFVSHK